jgi:hypothetical protein
MRDVILLMKQQMLVTHLYKFLQEAEEIDRSSTDQHLSMLYSYENTRNTLFCGHIILIEGVFVTQLSISAGI